MQYDRYIAAESPDRLLFLMPAKVKYLKRDERMSNILQLNFALLQTSMGQRLRCVLSGEERSEVSAMAVNRSQASCL